MTLSPPAGATGSGVPAAQPDAPLKALNPLDGLFLRAEHLAAIQDYAAGLSRAVARAGGAGVAYGCTATYSGGTVTVSEGLAIAPTGQPLLLTTDVSAQTPEPGTAPYLVVQLVPHVEPTGSPEQVYGVLCDDPCAGGETFRPYLADRVRIAFRQLSLTLPAWTGGQLRSAVASAYFEAERTATPSLLPTSERDPNTLAALDSTTWSTGTDPSAPGGVPVGLLVRVGSDWQLDVWAARRDRMEPPPERGWARRTGRRPRDVFLAQVVQFQAQLVHLGIPTRVRAGLGVPALPDDFVELPPAGYLPVDPSTPLTNQVIRLLGPGVDVRFCTARPDEIGLALERARNLDRIRLSAAAVDGRPKVDVIVPGGVPSTQWTTSTARFARGEVLVTTEDKHPYEGLGRLSWVPGSAVTAAFAAEGRLPGRGEGLWAELSASRSPFELRRGQTTLLQATLAARQTRNRSKRRLGEALQRFDLFGELECLDARLQASSGLPTFEGRFRGSLIVRLGSQREELSVTETVRLSVARQEASRYVVRAELSGPLLSETLEVRAEHGSTGWALSFQLGGTDRVTTSVAAEFEEIAAADVPSSPFRWSAERGLDALAATDFPLDAVALLFAEGGPPATDADFTTTHDWVFFTRRHLLECAPLGALEPSAFRLDLYVDDTGVEPTPPAEPGEPSEPGQPAEPGEPAVPVEPEEPPAQPAEPGLGPAVPEEPEDVTVPVDAAPSMPADGGPGPDPIAAPAAPARRLRYVAQLGWSLETDLLLPDSAAAVDAWRLFHPAGAPAGATIWAGSSMTVERGRLLVDQVVRRMSQGATVAVQVQPGPPEIPTTAGSSGVVVVSLTAGGLATTLFRIASGGHQ